MGMAWVAQAAASGLGTSAAPLGYVLNLKLSNPADAVPGALLGIPLGIELFALANGGSDVRSPGLLAGLRGGLTPLGPAPSAGHTPRGER
jgi:hypothetical protein